jgi:hypothetical protein
MVPQTWLNWLEQHLRVRSLRRKPKSRNTSLALESLENRWLLSVFNVTTGADGAGVVTPAGPPDTFNATTLRAAVIAANDTITHGTSSTINLPVLPASAHYLIDPALGELPIQGTSAPVATTIQTSTAGQAIIDAQKNVFSTNTRIFHVFSSNTLNIINLELRNGEADGDQNTPARGGAIFNSGTLNIQASKFINNEADGYGGLPIDAQTASLSASQSLTNLGLFDPGHNFYFNARGVNEKYLQGPNNTWYYFLPTGGLYQWNGSLATSPLLNTYDAAYWRNPNLYLNSQFQDLTQADLLQQQYGLFNPGNNYYFNTRGLSEKYLQGTGNQWFYILPNGALYQWGGSLQSSISLGTLGSSFWGSPGLLLNPQVPNLVQAYQEQQQLELTNPGNGYYFNARGLSEKYLVSANNTWFHILPNGDLYAYSANAQSTTLLASLGSAYWADPSMLLYAPAPASNDVTQQAVDIPVLHPQPAQGGAIYNDGELTVADTTYQGNIARGGSANYGRTDNIGVEISGADGLGGAIFLTSQRINTIKITGSTFAENQAIGGDATHTSGTGGEGVFGGFAAGGAIYRDRGAQNLTIANSTFAKISGGSGNVAQGGSANDIADDNSRGGFAQGGAIFLNSDPVAPSGPTGITGPTGPVGNAAAPSPLINLTNVTIAYNQALGGEAFVDDDPVPGDNGSSEGGGIFAGGESTPSAPQLLNTIVALNSAETGPDLEGNFNSLGHNLIGKINGGNGNLTFVAGSPKFDQFGTIAVPLNPGLDTFLKNNGGVTQTLALLQGSKAIDTGDNIVTTVAPPGLAAPLSFDQRESPFLRKSGPFVDIGAFEVQQVIVSIFGRASFPR